jgi:hypothetical protein
MIRKILQIEAKHYSIRNATPGSPWSVSQYELLIARGDRVPPLGFLRRLLLGRLRLVSSKEHRMLLSKVSTPLISELPPTVVPSSYQPPPAVLALATDPQASWYALSMLNPTVNTLRCYTVAYRNRNGRHPSRVTIFEICHLSRRVGPVLVNPALQLWRETIWLRSLM